MPSGKICNQEKEFEAYADGARKASAPFVVYAGTGSISENGSTQRFHLDGGVDGAYGIEENGPRDNNRIACVMVGWKSPPYSE